MRNTTYNGSTYEIEVTMRYPGRHSYNVKLIDGTWPENLKEIGALCDNRFQYFGGNVSNPRQDGDTESVGVTCYVD